MNRSTTLEFLIPSYKRPHTLVQAIRSVALQAEELNLGGRVKVTVVDDCSPNVPSEEVVKAIAPFAGFVTFRKNSRNKGVSLNFRDMVAGSDAAFCVGLTDDDRLQPNSLEQIMDVLDRIERQGNPQAIGSLFVPRYSYLEDGSLYCIECNPLKNDTRIKAGPFSSLRYLRNGFILTGLFFNPKLIDFQHWDANIENSFFPVIFFADLLLRNDCLFLQKNWFVHKTLNECHWDAWGKTPQARLARLYRDYMLAVTIASQKAFSETSGALAAGRLFIEEFFCYKNQVLPGLSKEVKNVDARTASRVPYQLAQIFWGLCSFKSAAGSLLAGILRKLMCPERNHV